MFPLSVPLVETLAKSMLSFKDPELHEPDPTDAAKVRVPTDPPSVPISSGAPQILPPSMSTASATVNAFEATTSMIPSWVKVPVLPPGLENVSEVALGTSSVPVESFKKVELDDGRV